MTTEEIATELLLARKEEEYEKVRAAYYGGDETAGPKLAVAAAKFDAMRTEYLEAYGPQQPSGGDAVVVTEPVASASGLEGMGN